MRTFVKIRRRSPAGSESYWLEKLHGGSYRVDNMTIMPGSPPYNAVIDLRDDDVIVDRREISRATRY